MVYPHTSQSKLHGGTLTHSEHADVFALLHIAHRHASLLQGTLEAEAAAQVEAHHVLHLCGIGQQVGHLACQYSIFKHTVLGTVGSVGLTGSVS